MRIAIINGSVRKDNTTMIVSRALQAAARDRGWTTEIVPISPFNKLFTGEYVKATPADAAQAKTVAVMRRADCLVFVVPTYFKSMPGGLKNFFDLVRMPKLYKDKLIMVVASNHKNQDYGARHAEEVIKGILIYFEIQAVVVPEIAIIHPQAIDDERMRHCIDLLANYARPA